MNWDVYELNYLGSDFGYAATFRNAKKFSINENIFFAPSRKSSTLCRGVIIGIELTDSDNPEYLYKIKFKEESKNEIIKNVDCDSIFYTVKEAKESAIKNCERMYELQKEQIKTFFNRFCEDEAEKV